jgi:DNA-binding transcriptional LysR family regulator
MSLDLESLKVFVKVAELGSFTRAGEQLGMPKARVSLRVQRIEAELGSRLLQRSTRVVRLTADGEQLLARAQRLLVEAEQLAAMFQAGRSLRGRVRVDLPVNLARDLIIPRLPELLARHPDLEMVVGTTDRRVEAFREGIDCVLRVGPVGDPGLVGRKLGVFRMMNLASPGYLNRHGLPTRLEDLDRHLIVHYASSGAEPPSFEYPAEGGYRQWRMRCVVTVNSVDAYQAAGAAGLGIIQVPRTPGMLARVAAGEFVELLPDWPCAPLPISILHTHGRNAPRRVRAVMAWIAELFTAQTERV